MTNIKLGADTLTGVNKIRVWNADANGQYVSFGLSGDGDAPYSNSTIGGRLVYKPV